MPGTLKEVHEELSSDPCHLFFAWCLYETDSWICDSRFRIENVCEVQLELHFKEGLYCHSGHSNKCLNAQSFLSVRVSQEHLVISNGPWAQSSSMDVISSVELDKVRGDITKDFIEFMRRRNLNERKVQEKNMKPNKIIAPLAPKESIYETNFRIFIVAGWTKASSIKALIEQQIGEGVLKRFQMDDKGRTCI